MILAQNHQLPLNGNKYIACLAFLCFSIVSFANHSRSFATDSIIINDYILVVENNDTVDSIPLIKNDSIAINVALLLPLYLDSNKIDFKTTPFYKRTLIGLSFLEGALLAIDSLEHLGYKINLSIYDTYNDSMQMDSIIKDSSIYQQNIIFGPIYNKNYKQLLKHVNAYNIPLISPLSSSPIAISSNYIKNTPSLTNHADKVLSYLIDSTNDRKVILLQKEKITKEEKIFIKRYNKIPNVTVIEKDNPTWKEILDTIQSTVSKTDSQCILLMPFSQESSTYYIFTQLRLMQQNSPDSLYIEVFGMPHWFNFESIDISYFINFGVHISNSCWINYKSNIITHFRNSFYKNHKMEPNKYNYFGFENIFYYTQFYSKSNGHIQNYSYKWKGMTNDFSLTPNIIQPTNDGDTILNFENQNLHLIKYTPFGVKKIR